MIANERRVDSVVVLSIEDWQNRQSWFVGLDGNHDVPDHFCIRLVLVPHQQYNVVAEAERGGLGDGEGEWNKKGDAAEPAESGNGDEVG